MTDSARDNMIRRQIRPWNVLEPRVLEALEAIPREDFVPEHLRGMAYSDLQLPLGNGEVMMEPRLEGRMLQELDPAPGEKALEVGTGSGYVTACLAHLCGHVTSVELHADLHRQAQQRLEAAGVAEGTELVQGDAAHGWHDAQHYDVISVTGSLPELHDGFHSSLTIGGRLFVIVGQGPMMEALRITRTGPNAWSTQSVFDTAVPPLRGLTKRDPFKL
ncbi:protein-L-isoaspartate O-methyltransferase [Halorhodospira halophila]|uniref:protein-L-isoaspartate O-methyltransferase family protein n=1 Tax=Halorhodospira halophila TaxID=1053 RepID=UPI0030B85EEA